GYREWIVISISFLLTAFVYMIAGQRSGLFIMIMQFLIVYSIRGDLKLGTMVKVGIVLFSLVAVVTVARLGDSLATEGLQNTIFGRYFFDVEKIAGVIYFAVGTDTYPYSPFHIMTEVSNSPGFQPEFHRFIGESIFNTRNGIPLSLLGEIIYFLGPVFIVPASIVYSIFVRSMEYRIYASSATYFRLLLIVVLGNVYYFSLNANTFDLLKRLTLDLSYLFLAFLVFHIVDIFRNSRGRSAGATALRE
ncbi:MAG: hypothetical protein KDK27_20695, partial [Leptospiraceae bacterium]|nr:hypothetical protein [Leptospiraceae bacterium]